MSPSTDRRVVVVTGGGGGIGAAIAVELGRQGHHVVTLDPLVTVDGTAALAPVEETTADLIVAAGGSARASAASVTDREAVEALFAELVREHGRLDGVVNVAGITRPTGFAKGTEEDWAAVLAVHLDGYRNVLAAALPIMAAAGAGRILGVTSGSGWRAADAGAYSCAKRAVASLTWQLGRAAPAGVAVNAISPIAMTRMVTAALERAAAGGAPAGERKAGDGPGGGAARGGAATGGLSLAGMPAPEDLGPLGALLAGTDIGLRGQVLFAGGSEVAVVDPPRLLEVVRTDGTAPLDRVLADVTGALVQAEAAQATTGGSNPRFGSTFAQAGEPAAAEGSRGATVVIVSDRPPLGAAIADRLRAGSSTATVVPAGDVAAGFAAARTALDSAAAALGGADAVVVALAGGTPGGGATGWEAVLAEHTGIAGQLLADAAWARAAADHAAGADRPLRLVTVVDAGTAGGSSRGQAAAQLARASRRATGERVAAFAIAVEATGEVDATAALAAHLATDPAAPGLSGAELVVGPGWIGLRSHPRPAGSIVYGGPELPGWFPGVLGEVAGSSPTVEIAP